MVIINRRFILEAISKIEKWFEVKDGARICVTCHGFLSISINFSLTFLIHYLSMD
jgi:hypothetical protein